ncbi:hypothetical protein [Dyella acidisoli]|uniref:hypothetical protein n=1 Tax=Dyella acidisoli TaxID=1867834 RepID=UPI0024E0FD4B|nr:hypothetical protein [Dyella acidisoli]
MQMPGRSALLAVIPAKAGIHVALMQKAKMDSRFRGNDGQEEMSIPADRYPDIKETH